MLKKFHSRKFSTTKFYRKKHLIPIYTQSGFFLPDIIFLDLSMPVLDGWGVLEEYIKLKPRFGKKITLYIISSSVSPQDHERARHYNDVSDFIIKPMSTDKFIDIIKNLEA